MTGRFSHPFESPSAAASWWSRLAFMAILLFATEAFAQAWKDGQMKLMKGDYKGAEASLSKSYRSARGPQERSEVLKYLGVAQYMQAKSAQASKTFALAFKNNPNVKLGENDVADESVIPFFYKQKPAGKIAQAKQAPRTKLPPTVREPSAKPSPTAVKSTKTLLKIVTNVKNAQVSLDGIAYGLAGSDMEVSPGTLVLEISAPGYIKKAIKINIAAKTANTVKVNLEKPQPKPKAVAKSIPLPSTQPAGGGSGKSSARTAGAKSSKGADLFASDPGSPDDFSSFPGQGSPSTAQQAQGVTPPPAPQAPVLPQGAYAAPGYPLQQPMQPPPMMLQPPMFAPQPFMSPYGGYMQPQQPYYPQPQPPPSVYSPYQGYQQPAPPPFDPYGGYVAPPPETAPSMSLPPPVADNPAAPTDNDSFGQPPPMKPPRDLFTNKKKKRRSAQSSSDCAVLVKLLPLGAGQFCQGSTFKGVLFAGAQVGGLFFYKQNSDAAAKFQTQLTTLQKEREEGKADYTGDELVAYEEETAQKEAAGKKAIETAETNATMSLAVFGGSWALGVVDSFAFAPTKSKKASKRARLSLLLPTREDQGSKIALVTDLSKNDQFIGSWYVGYTGFQNVDRDPGSIKFGLSLEL